jgi:hypothetical protein
MLPKSYRNGALYALGYASRLVPVRKFFIVSPARAGTELLVRLLASHPAISCEGELFQEPRRLPLRWADGRAVVARVRGSRAWGCKLLDHHVLAGAAGFGPPARFFRRAKTDGWTLIRLARGDALTQALSQILVRHHTASHFTSGDDVAFEPLTVDVAELITTIVMVEQHARAIDAGLGSIVDLQLRYEDDLRGADAQQHTVDRICVALGLESAPASADLVTIAPPRVQDRVSNWDEIADVLARTRYRDLVERD